MKMADIQPDNQPLWAGVLKVLPGLAGSVVATYYVLKPEGKAEAIIGVVCGTLAAVFFGPYAASVIAPDNPNANAGIVFATGLVTLVFLPPLVTKVRELIAQLSWGVVEEWLPWKKTP